MRHRIVPSAAIVLVSSSIKATTANDGAKLSDSDAVPTVAVGSECPFPSSALPKGSNEALHQDGKRQDGSADVGVLARQSQQICRDGQMCIADGSSSLGGRCRDVNIPKTVPRPMLTAKKNRRRRDLQEGSNPFDCPTGCPQDFCDCATNDGNVQNCAAELHSVCVNGTLTNCVPENFINFYREVYCNFASCLVNGTSYEDCSCGYYKDYCNLYYGIVDSLERCEASECCAGAVDSQEKYMCLPAFAPTSSPTKDQWYIDWSNFVCKKGNPQEEFIVEFFDTMEACCEGSLSTSAELAESCLIESVPRPPLTSSPAPSNNIPTTIPPTLGNFISPAPISRTLTPTDYVRTEVPTTSMTFSPPTPATPTFTVPLIPPTIPAPPTVSPAPSTNRHYCGSSQADAQNRCDVTIPCPEKDSIVCLIGQTCYQITGPCGATSGDLPTTYNIATYSPMSPTPTFATPPPPASPTPSPTETHVFDPNATNFCGIDYDDVVKNCYKNRVCPTGNTTECPSGQMCFPDLPYCNTPSPTTTLIPTDYVTTEDPTGAPTFPPPTQYPTFMPTADVYFGDNGGSSHFCTSSLVSKSLVLGAFVWWSFSF
eukprot:CAMPEP_0183716166 /NCGR_PEP_ID=MMETSP0737-20130205/10163_1 /TAXON_ID=385413 /ORGANISM="Thalassiosira miniscula, Strain CCMP1093" /LENGTH=596 /DNA_ID=CAMNT_0025945387 /DNA_START=33 /DNA_END=1823 /DNA_ORIENTATION=-